MDETKHPMTPDQFKAAMLEAFAGDDKESNHSNADDLMCRVLIQLGYAAGVSVFMESDKWYA